MTLKDDDTTTTGAQGNGLADTLELPNMASDTANHQGSSEMEVDVKEEMEDVNKLTYGLSETPPVAVTLLTALQVQSNLMITHLF